MVGGGLRESKKGEWELLGGKEGTGKLGVGGGGMQRQNSEGSHRLMLCFLYIIQEREQAPKCSTLCPQGSPLPALLSSPSYNLAQWGPGLLPP